MSAVLVESDRLGSLEMDETAIIEMPSGILGFPDLHRYALVAADDDGLYSWLQSLDDPSLAFLAVVPAPFFPDYAPVISDEDCRRLQLLDPSDGDARVIALLSFCCELVVDLPRAEDHLRHVCCIRDRYVFDDRLVAPLSELLDVGGRVADRDYAGDPLQVLSRCRRDRRRVA